MSDTERASGAGPDGDRAGTAAPASWRRAYLVVLGVLAADVGLLWLLGRMFR